MLEFIHRLLDRLHGTPQSQADVEWLAREERVQLEEVRERLERAEEQLHFIERRRQKGHLK